MLSFRALAHLTLLLFPACTTNLIGTQTAQGFTSATYAFGVKNKPSSGVFDGSQWLLENVREKGGAGELVSKVGGDYQRSVRFDTDGDGSYETSESFYRNELSFRHRKTNAEISLSVLPMDQTMADTDMEVLVENYVDAVSGGGSISVSIDPGTVLSAQRRFATRILDAATFRVAGEPAAGATFEVANVDQLELSKEARWQRARVVLVRPPWHLPAKGSAWPVLIRILYSSRLESFEDHESDLAELVNGIDFGPYRDVLDAHAESTKQCVEVPTARMRIYLATTAKGGVGMLRLASGEESGESISAFNQGTCVAEALGATPFPQSRQAVKMVWAVDQGGHVIPSLGVPSDAKAFRESAWPPVRAVASPQTSGGETLATPQEEPAVPTAIPPSSPESH